MSDANKQLLERMKSATHFSRLHLSKWIQKAERAFADLDRKVREDAQLCRWCFYARDGRLGGQAITNRSCDACGCEQTFSSTATDPLCAPCARKMNACVSCCADIDLVDRRKLEYSAKGRR